jgi:hypothetical protein
LSDDRGGPAQAVSLGWGEYFTWTGRFFVTATTYFVLGGLRHWTVPGFDVANALVFGALVDVVLRLAPRAAADGARHHHAAWQFATWLLAALLLWWLPRTVGEAALWKTGSVVYLWAVTGELFVLERMLDSGRWRWPAATGLAALPFVVGNFLEPLAVLMTALLSAIVLRRWRAGRRLPRTPAAVALAHLAGRLMLLAAPGNLARAATTAGGTPGQRSFSWYGFIGSLFDVYWLIALAAIALLWLPPEASLGATAGAPVRLLRRLPGRRGGATFVGLAAGYLMLLLGVPYHLLSPRVSFPASVLLVAQLLVLVLLRPASRRRDIAGAVIASVLFAASTAVAVAHLTAIARINDAWSRDLARQRAAGARDAELPVARIAGRSTLARKDRFLAGIEPGTGDWKIRCYAAAQGFRSIRGL